MGRDIELETLKAKANYTEKGKSPILEKRLSFEFFDWEADLFQTLQTPEKLS